MPLLGASARQLIVALLVGRLAPRSRAGLAAWVVGANLSAGALALWWLSRRRPARLKVAWSPSARRLPHAP